MFNPLKLLNLQGKVASVICLILVALLVLQKGETRHWHKQSDRYEALYTKEHDTLVKERERVRAAREVAAAEDKANIQRVKAEAAALNERTSHDFETRLAAARAAADRLRNSLAASVGTASGGGRAAPVPGISAAPGGPAQAAGDHRLPVDSAASLSIAERLIATEQAIQLDELIKWVKGAGKIAPNQPTTTPKEPIHDPAR